MTPEATKIELDAPLLADALDGASEPLEPGGHILGFLPVEHPSQVLDDLARVVVGDLGAPTGADAVGAVDEDHGDDGDVPLGLDLLVVVGQVVEDGVVVGVEDQPGQRAHLGEDVTRAGVVLKSTEQSPDSA